MNVDGDLIVAHNSSKTVVKVGEDGVTSHLASGPEGPQHPLYAFGSLWFVLPSPAGGTYSVRESDGGISSYGLTAVVRLDPTSGAHEAQLPAHATVLAATQNEVWAMGEKGFSSLSLWKIDPMSNEVTEFPGLLSGRVSQLLYDGNLLWAVIDCYEIPCPSGSPRLVAVDPASASVVRQTGDLPAGFMATDAAIVDGILWVGGIANLFQSGDFRSDIAETLFAFALDGELQASYRVGDTWGIAGDSGGIWTSHCFNSAVNKWDSASGELIIGPVTVGKPYPSDEEFDPYREDFSCPRAVLLSGNTLWVANWNDDAITPVR